MGPTKVKVTSFLEKKKKGEKIVAITAYDYTTARLIDEQVDIVLVGDSLGMVIQGNDHTLSVTLDDVIYHSRAVARGLRHAHLVADMPFMTYQSGARDALKNAGRLLAQGNVEAVKVEGGANIAKIAARLVETGIPVMGHIGLTPQSVHAFGGYKIQGKTDAAKESILNDALALEDAGCYAIVLEGVPSDLGKIVSERLVIPTIGIGAGPFCDGQILVGQDLLGMNPHFQPKFVKRYERLADTIQSAVRRYAEEVRKGEFPTADHSF